MAGESAGHQAEKHRRKADQWERGAQGERETAAALAGLPAGWTVLHDVAWPDRQLANIDHVVVGPPGVFVIDTKNWSGRIEVDHGVLRQDRRSRVPTLQSALAGAAAVAKVVPEVRRDHVYAVLCFSSEAPDAMSDGVLVCSTASLPGLLTSRPAVLPDELVSDVAGVLRSRLPDATAPRPAQVAKRKPRPQQKPKKKPKPVSKRPSRYRSRKNTTPNDLVKLIAAVAMGLTLVANPAVFTAVSNGLSGLLVDQASTPDDQQIEPPEKKKDRPGVKKQNQQQSQR